MVFMDTDNITWSLWLHPYIHPVRCCVQLETLWRVRQYTASRFRVASKEVRWPKGFIFRFISVCSVSTVTCLHALMFRKLYIFLILPVLQHLFSPSVWNQSPVCSDWLAGRLCCDWWNAQRCPAYHVQRSTWHVLHSGVTMLQEVQVSCFG